MTETQPEDQVDTNDSAEDQEELPNIDELEESQAAIEKRLNSGVRRVTHGKKTVEYDLSALEKARKRNQDEIEEAKAEQRGLKRLRQVRVRSRRGY